MSQQHISPRSTVLCKTTENDSISSDTDSTAMSAVSACSSPYSTGLDGGTSGSEHAACENDVLGEVDLAIAELN